MLHMSRPTVDDFIAWQDISDELGTEGEDYLPGDYEVRIKNEYENEIIEITRADIDHEEHVVYLITGAKITKVEI